MTRLQKIDELTQELHYHLRPADDCYFFYEYTSGKNYSFSETNQLISNLKKSPIRRGMSDYAYKTRAINRVSSLFTAALNAEWLKDAVLVPTPPSKMPDHPEYDDRIERVCKGIKPEDDVTVRNIVRQTKSYQASSSSPGSRITVDELLSIYKIDENEAIPDPKYIGIVDDLLTAATHYRAMHTMLRSRYPTSHITGLFIARRVFPETESVVI